MSSDDITNLSVVKEKLDDQGQHECDVWSQGQADAEGAASWRRCKKNPGHPGFIPAANFSMEHLPEEYRNPAMLEAIKLNSDLSVRLRVKYTTTARPPEFPFANFGGKNITHTGSGMVTIMLEKPETGPCPCSECLRSWSEVFRKSHKITTTDEGDSTLNYTNDSGNTPTGDETGPQDADGASGCQTQATRTATFSKENLQNTSTNSRGDKLNGSNLSDDQLTCASNKNMDGAQYDAKTEEEKSATTKDEVNIVTAMTNWLYPKDVEAIYDALKKSNSTQESDGQDDNGSKMLDMTSPTGVNVKKSELCTTPVTSGKWWQVKVRTAMHVVYDHLEAASTLVDFYYEQDESDKEKQDEGNSTAMTSSLSASSQSTSIAGVSPTALSSRVTTMRGVCLTSFNSDTDECEILCITHDEELAKILKRDLPRLNTNLQNLSETVAHSLSSTIRTESVLPPLCVVASHPHGCAKTVTVGEWKERRVVRRVDSAMVLAGYHYTADTCPGSSGATIFLCGHGVGEGLLAFQSISTPCHSGSKKSGLNFSAPWVEWESIALSDSVNDDVAISDSDNDIKSDEEG